MSGIFNTISSVFTEIPTRNAQKKFKKQKKTIQQFIKATDIRFNEVFKLLINNYLSNDKLLVFQLLDSTICSKTAIYLTETLQKQLESIDFKDTKILFEQKEYKCDTYNSCEKLLRQIKFKSNNGTITNKKELCDKITIFHIRIMNLVSALLVQLDPNNNIAIQRMNILYNSINDNELQISLCTDNKLITEYGLNELINLYLYNLLLSSDNFTETSKLVDEYNKLVNILKNNLSDDVNPVIANDIRIITGDIKQGLVEFHNKFRKSIPISINEESGKELTKKTNNEENRSTSKEKVIKKQEIKIKDLKSELLKLRSQLSKEEDISSRKIKELEVKLSNITKKYILLEEKINTRNENNIKVSILKDEILTLISQLNTKINSTKQSGGDIADTAKRFTKFMKKFNVTEINNVSKIKNKFFNIFEKSLRIPTIIENICSQDLDESRIITINYTEDDTQINNYLQVYNDMTTYYINTIKEIIRIIEKEILYIEYNDKKKAVKVKIRKFTDSNLKKKETEIRLLIVNYINRIHEYYINGINQLNIFLSNR
jgi:hypothetical protein